MKRGFISAKNIHEKLQDTIKKARKGLDADQSLEVLHYLPDGSHLLVEGSDAHGRALISLYGHDVSGNPCTVLVHAHSLQVVLRVVKDELPDHEEPVEATEEESASVEPEEMSDEPPTSPVVE